MNAGSFWVNVDDNGDDSTTASENESPTSPAICLPTASSLSISSVPAATKTFEKDNRYNYGNFNQRIANLDHHLSFPYQQSQLVPSIQQPNRVHSTRNEILEQEFSQAEQSLLHLSQLDSLLPEHNQQFQPTIMTGYPVKKPLKQLPDSQSGKPAPSRATSTDESIRNGAIECLRELKSEVITQAILMRKFDVSEIRALLKYKFFKITSKMTKPDLCAELLKLIDSGRFVSDIGVRMLPQALLTQQLDRDIDRTLSNSANPSSAPLGVAIHRPQVILIKQDSHLWIPSADVALGNDSNHISHSVGSWGHGSSDWTPWVHVVFDACLSERRDMITAGDIANLNKSGVRSELKRALRMDFGSFRKIDMFPMKRKSEDAFQDEESSTQSGSTEQRKVDSLGRTQPHRGNEASQPKGQRRGDVQVPGAVMGNEKPSVSSVLGSIRTALVPGWRSAFESIGESLRVDKREGALFDPLAAGDKCKNAAGTAVGGMEAETISPLLNVSVHSSRVRNQHAPSVNCMLGMQDRCSQTDMGFLGPDRQQLNITGVAGGTSRAYVPGGPADDCLETLFRPPVNCAAVKLVCFKNEKLGLSLCSRVDRLGRFRTVIEAKNPLLEAEIARTLSIGDTLVSIGSSYSVVHMPWAGQRELIKSSPRPIVLGFASSESN